MPAPIEVRLVTIISARSMQIFGKTSIPNLGTDIQERQEKFAKTTIN